MKAYCPLKNVVHVTFNTQYECCSTFVRLQEFYESPLEGINGSYFTLEDFMDSYAASRPNYIFDYFEHWAGFNLPCDVVRNFEKVFKGKLLRKEKKLLTLIKKTLKANGWQAGERFYVIGTFDSKGKFDDDTIVDHELAHALFYLSPAYNRRAKALVGTLSMLTYSKFATALLARGYGENVILDEIQAYLATGYDHVFEGRYKTLSKQFTALYAEFRNLYLVES